MSLATYGLGLTTPPLVFLMRAYHTVVPTGYFYWTVEETPDTTGTQSGYPTIELAPGSIVVAYAYPQTVP